MKDRLKNNIGLKLMALLFAIFLWWTVVNIEDPLDTRKYAVEVLVTNPEVITNAGKSYQITDDTKSVIVTVKARRKVLAEIATRDIVATADLREMQDTSVPIRVKINGFEGDYEEVTANPRNIQVKTENTQKKTFPISTSAIGTPRDGYVVGSITSSPKTVDISGPESSIAKISKVVAKVDVSELAADATYQTELIYFDAADNIIDKTLLTSNCDKNGVSVQVSIWKTKNVNLKFDISEIRPAEGFAVKGIEIEPQTVEIAGNPEILSAMNVLEIGPEALKRDSISENEEVIVELNPYLPEGIDLADADGNSVVVRIIVEKAGTKSLLVPTGRITVDNLSDKLQLAYEQMEVELKFSGAEEVLETLTIDKIIAKIDLATCKEKGTYEVPIKITQLPEQCRYMEEVIIHIELTEKKDDAN